MNKQLVPEQNNLKLSQKALILVSVPLLFEIIFVVVLLGMVGNSEKETEQAERSRLVIVYADNLIRKLYELGMATFAQNTMGGQFFVHEYDRAAKRIREDMKDLVEMVSDDPKQQATAKDVEHAVSGILQVFDAGRHVIENENQDFPLRSEQFDFRSELEPALKELVPKVQELTAREKELRRANPDSEKSARRLVRIAVIVGIVLNIILALWLAHFFNRSTTERLNVVLDNTNRFAANEPLHPLLPGNDEIVQVDKTFHNMVTVIEKAAQKERAIIRNAIDVICSIKSDGTFVAISQGVEDAWGYKPSDLEGKQIYEIIPEPEREGLEKGFKRLQSQSSKENLATKITRADGELRDVLCSANWVQDEESFFCVVHDVSAQKEVERMKQEFVQMVSHDLRTPLASIHFFLSALMDGAYGDVSDRCKKTATNVASSARRLIGLVNDLLELEKLSAGPIPLEWKTCSMEKVLHFAKQSLRGFAEQNQVKLKVVVEPDFEFQADEDRLVQVIVNLASNAIKFSPPNETVSLEGSKFDDYVELRVADHGRGIPPEMKDKIFERFKQVQKEDATVKGGTGLGLAICKSLIDSHGGTIGVDSEVGKGSTFWVRIPQQTKV